MFLEDGKQIWINLSIQSLKNAKTYWNNSNSKLGFKNKTKNVIQKYSKTYNTKSKMRMNYRFRPIWGVHWYYMKKNFKTTFKIHKYIHKVLTSNYNIKLNKQRTERLYRFTKEIQATHYYRNGSFEEIILKKKSKKHNKLRLFLHLKTSNK